MPKVTGAIQPPPSAHAVIVEASSLGRPVPEVMDMAGGYSNREIAEALGTAEGTVKNHASSILSKLGVRDRTRAVLKALELGYI